MIDSHAHANFRKLHSQIDSVVERARNAGVFSIVNIGIDIGTSLESIELSERFPDIVCTVGIHPNALEDRDDIDELIVKISQMAKHPCVVAIGEIGLDFYRDFVRPDRQKILLKKQLDLAEELGMPVVLHLRDQKDGDVFEVFKEIFHEYRNLRGVLHAFSGDEAFVRWAVEETNLLFGLGGPITFKNYKSFDAIRAMPLERIIIETDCPYLAPHPHRGKTNEPAYVRLVAERLSDFFRLPVEEIDRITSYNTAKLFKLGLPDKGKSQVFLESNDKLDKIASVFDDFAKSTVALEIGAGQAVLTERLCKKFAKVYAVEPDLAVYPLNYQKAVVIPRSVMDIDLKALSEYTGEKLNVFGNIPYHLTTDILFFLTSNIAVIDNIALLIQKEVALRLSATHGNKDYGIPTVLIGNLFEINLRFDIPAGAFKPVPAVDSSLITMIPRPQPVYQPRDYALFERIVRSAFGQRRKMIRKSLDNIVKNIPSHLKSKRPEELTIEDFGLIADSNS